MANEINFSYIAGNTVYYLVKNTGGLYYDNLMSHVFETYSAIDWPRYAIPMTDATNTGQYVGSFPTPIQAGSYGIEIYAQATGTPMFSDGPPIGVALFPWNGSREITLYEISFAPAIFASVASFPTPTTTVFNLNLINQTLGVGITPGSFIGLYLTCMPGGVNVSPIFKKIVNCVIVNSTTITITLETPLVLAPDVGDPVSISG